MKKILVIGGSGFVGRNITLMPEKFESYSLDRVTPTELSSIYVKCFKLDISDDEVYQIVSSINPDIVLVLAGKQFETPIQKRRNRRKSFDENRVIAEKVVAIVRKTPSINQVIYVSTDMVYGKPETQLITESISPKPIGEYGKSKLKAEEILSEHLDKLVVIRPRLIVGPGREGTISKLAKFVSLGLPVPIIGNGSNRYQMISVFDLWNAIDTCISKKARGVFNVGSRNPPPINDLFKCVLVDLGKNTKVVHLPKRITELCLSFLDLFGFSPLAPEQFMIAGRDCVLDTKKIEELGWSPHHSDREMLTQSLKVLMQ